MMLRPSDFLILLLAIVGAGAALAQPPDRAGGGVAAEASFTWMGSAVMAGQDDRLDFSRQSFLLTAPVGRAGAASYSLTGQVQRTRLGGGPARLAESGRELPGELWNASLRVAYLKRTASGRIFGWNAGAVSAGPRFFGGDGATKPTFFAFLRTPTAGGRDAWTLALIYLPFSDLRFPIPAAGYAWGARPNLEVNFGVPFSIQWLPSPGVTVAASWVPVLNVDARVTWQALAGLEFYGGYATTRETFVLPDRADPKDLLLENQQRVMGGAAVGLGRGSSLDFQSGYVFDRRYGEGRDGDRQSANRVDLGDGAFATVSLRSAF